MVPYRKAEPSEDDADTFAMKPGQFTIDKDTSGLTWCVGTTSISAKKRNMTAPRTT